MYLFYYCICIVGAENFQPLHANIIDNDWKFLSLHFLNILTPFLYLLFPQSIVIPAFSIVGYVRGNSQI